MDGSIPLKDMKPGRAPSLKHHYMQSPFISITASTPGSDEEVGPPPQQPSRYGNGGHPLFPEFLPAAATLRRHSSSETPDRAEELNRRTNSLPRLHHTSVDEVKCHNIVIIKSVLNH